MNKLTIINSWYITMQLSSLLLNRESTCLFFRILVLLKLSVRLSLILSVYYAQYKLEQCSCSLINYTIK